MSKEKFIDYLIAEFEEYHGIPPSEVAQRSSKKEFINGLMKASRFFDVKYEELENIATISQNIHKKDKKIEGCDTSLEYLDIPTFIRLNKT